MEKPSSRDLLSDLPLGIIHTVLEGVPIRDVVKTSVLSKKWRYIWASLPQLVFDNSCVPSLENDEIGEKIWLKDFITQALFLHQGPIHKFVLAAVPFDFSTFIDQWLLFLSRNDIRILILYPGRAREYCVHSSLYSCQNLIQLEVYYMKIPLPSPTFEGFLFLRKLVLHFDVSSNTIENVVSKSPLLEELELDNVGGDIELRIRAPNLKDLVVSGYYKYICVYAPLLVKLYVDLSLDLAEYLQPKTSVCNYTKVLGGFTCLEELCVNHDFIKYLSVGVESCRLSLVFYHLRVISLFDLMLGDIEVLSTVVGLITDAPNLQKLEISNYSDSRDSPEVDSLSFWDSECAPNFTFERLKLIKMKYVCGELYEMKFIKFLLASSPVLETMICEPKSTLTDKVLLNMTPELLRYHRASTNSEILFSKR